MLFERTRKQLLIAAIAVATGLMFVGSPLFAQSVWTGGTSNWNDASNWSPAGVPNGAGFDVLIDNGDGTDSVVALDISVTVNTLTLDLGDTVNQNNASNFNILNGLTNNGTWNNLGGASFTDLFFNGSQTLDGTGEVVLNSDAQSRITGVGVITNGAAHTIRGGGNFLANTAGLINNGTIIGDGTRALRIDPNANGFTNNNILRATSTEGIDLFSGTFANTTTIEALAGSRVDLSTATIVGGTLSSTGTGQINIVASSTLDGVTIATGSTVNQNNAARTTILNGLTNNGTWNNLGGASFTDLFFSGSQTLGGTGVVVLNSDPQSRITGSGGVITHGADHTIRGGGSLLANLAGMINNGTIIGDGTTALVIDPNGNGFTNNNILRATSTEGIDLNNGTFTNNSTIEALVDSRVDLSAAIVVGGTLSSTGTGQINIVGTSTLDGVTIATGSTVNQNNAARTTILNGLTNNGTWNNLGGASFTDLFFNGSQTLGGTGEVVLNSDPQSRITGNGGTTVITHGADHTIRGGGILLANSAGMINNGTILGDGAIALTIDPDGNGFTNGLTGIVQATSVTGIQLRNGTFTNTTTIEALAGSRVDLTGATVVGGTLSSTGTGQINIVGTSTLDGVTIATGSTVNQNNAARTTILNGLTNNGTWNNLGTTGTTDIQFNGSQTLDGTGEVVLNSDPQSRITGNIVTTITNGADHTIRGGGSLLANTAGLINNGTILGDGTTALVIDPNGNGFTNNNILRATSAAGIGLNIGTFTNTTTIEALAGSRVDLFAATVVGGTLSSTGTGQINIVNSSTLDGVTIATGSTVNQNNSRTATIFNGLTNNGTWNTLGTTSNTDIRFNGSQTLGGTGEVVLGSDPQSRITSVANTTVITHGADHTIRGGGSLLANTAGLINNGTIIGDGTTALVIDPNANGFTNNGLIRADDSSTVTILAGGTFTNTPGALLAGNGTIDISSLSSFTNEGGVAPGMSPGILNLIGNYNESATATLFIEIAGTTVGDDYDQFSITGDANLAGTLDIDLLGFLPSSIDVFTILTADSVSGMFSNAVGTVTTIEGHVFDVAYNNNGTGSVVLSNFVAVPEPGSLALLAIGGVLLFRRNRNG